MKETGGFDVPGDVPGLTLQAGMIVGTVSVWADAMDTTPERLLQAVDASGVTPLVDTAEHCSTYYTHKRPSDPNTRIIALRRSDAGAVRSALHPHN
jgi:hypothetical protein